MEKTYTSEPVKPHQIIIKTKQVKQRCNTLVLLSAKISALKIEKKANGNKLGDLPPSVPHFVQLSLCPSVASGIYSFGFIAMDMHVF